MITPTVKLFPNASRSDFLILLRTILSRPGTLSRNFAGNLRVAGNTLDLNIFSITKGTVRNIKGLTVPKPAKRRVGVGFPGITNTWQPLDRGKRTSNA